METVFYSTGEWDAEPTTGGSYDGWGEYFITVFHNNTGFDVTLHEMGMPCCGPATGDYGWIIWEDVGDIQPPTGDWTTADWYGAFTPADTSTDTFPPTNYTYIDLTAEEIVIPKNSHFCIGYQVTAWGSQIPFNSRVSWAWYDDAWDRDADYGRTALIQVMGEYLDDSGVQHVTWGAVKTLD